jgi:protein O-mannosyl-transferase
VRKFLVIFVCSVLTLSTLLVFWQVRNFDFVKYDDRNYVYENPNVLNGLTHDGIISAFTTPRSGNWLPLTWLSFMLDSQLFGLNPGRMHLVNLFFHIINTLLLFAVLKKMTGSLWPSAFVAAAFAIHPVHVESVAWVINRKDVLSTFFFMLTLAAYAGYVRGGGLFRYLLAILLFVFGLLAKPILVTLPFVLLLLDYWPLGRFAAPQAIETTSIPDKRRLLYRIIIEKIPFFVLAAVSSTVTFIAQKSGGSVPDINTISLQSRVANTLLSYTRYIGKMFWPQNLAVFYPRDIDRFSFWQIAMCAMLLLGISVFVIRFGRNRKYLPVGWFWFVGTLIPVIGLVQSGAQAYADRYTYIPYIGLFIMVAWGLPGLLSKLPQRKIALGLSMVIVLATLGICTHKQVSFWNNTITLFTHAIEVTQNNYVAYNNLGVALKSVDRYQDAIEAYKQAIKSKPDYVEAYYNLGIAYGKLGIRQNEIDAYKQTIRIKPDFTEAYINLGFAYNALGRYLDAINAYEQVTKLQPNYADGHFNLGVVYARLGRFQDAAEAFKRAVRIKPDFAEAYYNLGNSYGGLDRYQDAIEAFVQAIRIKPDWADAHYNLGNACLLSGDKQSALEEYNILKNIDAEQAKTLFDLINK